MGLWGKGRHEKPRNDQVGGGWAEAYDSSLGRNVIVLLLGPKNFDFWEGEKKFATAGLCRETTRRLGDTWDRAKTRITLQSAESGEGGRRVD